MDLSRCYPHYDDTTLRMTAPYTAAAGRARLLSNVVSTLYWWRHRITCGDYQCINCKRGALCRCKCRPTERCILAQSVCRSVCQSVVVGHFVGNSRCL